MQPELFKHYPGLRLRVDNVASVSAVECGLFNHVLSCPGVRALISELDLVPGSPLRPQMDASFEEEFEEMFRNEMRYIMRGLNPRYHRFRVRQDALFASSQLSFDF